MMDLLTVWKSTFAVLPLDATGPPGVVYPTTLAAWIAARVDVKMIHGPPFGGPPPVFTFDQPTFAAGIAGLPQDPIGLPGPTAFADAWKAAILTSIMVTPVGTFIGSPAPPSLYSAVFSTIVTTALLTAAHALLITNLIAAVPAATGLLSTYPDALFTAFSGLGYDVSGLDSVLPIPGPLLGSSTVI